MVSQCIRMASALASVLEAVVDQHVIGRPQAAKVSVQRVRLANHVMVLARHIMILKGSASAGALQIDVVKLVSKLHHTADTVQWARMESHAPSTHQNQSMVALSTKMASADVLVRRAFVGLHVIANLRFAMTVHMTREARSVVEVNLCTRKGCAPVCVPRVCVVLHVISRRHSAMTRAQAMRR